MVAPDRFVPLAEVTGLIGILTDHVLRASLAQCRPWLDRDLRIPVAVNLSARSLLDAEFPDRVAGCCAEHEVPPELLSFEITESSVMADPDRTLPVLHRLHALGHPACPSTTSAPATRRWPSCAGCRSTRSRSTSRSSSAMGTDLGDLAIVRAIIELGHSLGLRVVAEGVEDELARDLLRRQRLRRRSRATWSAGRWTRTGWTPGWPRGRAIAAGPAGVEGRRLQLLTRLRAATGFRSAARAVYPLSPARPLSSVGRASPW